MYFEEKLSGSATVWLLCHRPEEKSRKRALKRANCAGSTQVVLQLKETTKRTTGY